MELSFNRVVWPIIAMWTFLFVGAQATPIVHQRWYPDRSIDYDEESLSIELHDQFYRSGDAVRLEIRSTRDARIFVFSRRADGETRLLFPNGYDDENVIEADDPLLLPTPGFRLKTDGKGWEQLVVFAFDQKKNTPQRFPNWYSHPTKSDPFPVLEGGLGQWENMVKRVLPDGKEGDESVAMAETRLHVSPVDWKQQKPVYSKPVGTLRIDCMPRFSQVTISGTPYRSQPPRDFKLRPGRYRVEITSSNGSFWSDWITVYEGKVTAIKVGSCCRTSRGRGG